MRKGLSSSSARWCGAAVRPCALAALLTACGLSDRYFVDDSLANASSVGGAGGAGARGGSESSGGAGNSAGVEASVAGAENPSGGNSNGGSSSDGSSSGGASNPGLGGDNSSGGASSPASGGVSTNGGDLGGGGTLNTSGGNAQGGNWTDQAGAGGEAPGCTLGTFGAPEPIIGLGVSDDQHGPSLSADGRSLYFSVWDGSVDYIYLATRSDDSATFSAATKLPLLTKSDALPFLSRDGLTLYFVTPRTNGSDKDIWFATRSSLSDPFANAAQLSALNSSKNDQRPWLSADELTGLFVSDRMGGAGTLDIWSSTRTSARGVFADPVNLTSVNSAAQDEGPALSADGLTLYFSSNRGSSKDIYYATRADRAGNFGTVRPLTALNSGSDEVDLTLSANEREMFFVSSRSGSAQIWRATRSCL